MSSATTSINASLPQITTDTLSAEQKQKHYATVAKSIAAVLEDETNVIAKMATISSLLSHTFPSYFWTGFYLVDAHKHDELVVGPYQGTLGCTRIPFSKGVCGACATARETIVVPNVHEFPGHVACDGRSQSEIVVPVLDAEGSLIAVFDVDSEQLAAFDAVDKEWLERIVTHAFAR